MLQGLTCIKRYFAANRVSDAQEQVTIMARSERLSEKPFQNFEFYMREDPNKT